MGYDWYVGLVFGKTIHGKTICKTAWMVTRDKYILHIPFLQYLLEKNQLPT